MTEYELADLFNSTTTVLVAQFSLYLTILSAYFATAYIIGNGLTRSQLFSISMIFIAAAEIFSVAAFSAANRLAYTAQELSAISSGYPLSFFYWVGILIFVVMQLGIAASLKFMYDVRSTGGSSGA